MLESAIATIANHPWPSGAALAVALAVSVGFGWHKADPGPARHRRTSVTLPSARHVALDRPPVDQHGRTAYEQLGPAAIRTITDQFYSGVQCNPKLARYFRAEKMEHLKRHLPLMIGQLLGGPVKYPDPITTLREVHYDLQISPEAYSALIADLNTIFYRLQVPYDIRIFLMAKLIQVENLIISPDVQARPRR